MTRTKKILIVLAAGATIVVFGWTLLIGALFASGGFATVRIQDDTGPNLFIPVPVALVDVAAATGGMVIDGSVGHFDHDLGGHFQVGDLGDWSEMIEAMLEVIEDCPDVTFVEVQDGRDHVRVAKEGRYLRVEVSDPGFSLAISLPTKTATRTLARIVS